MSEKRAVLVGVNKYSKLDAKYQLSGCGNDVALVQSVLEGKFGFAPENIRVLLDEEATRDAILGAMDSLVEESEKDDIVVFHYSGHGSTRTDMEGDEPDGMDETIMPHDSGRAPHENRDITDDMIYDWLLRLSQKTKYVTVIFDCCHSGTVTRDSFGLKARAVEEDNREFEPFQPSVPVEESAPATRDAGPSGWVPVGERYVLFAGCRDEELSYEHKHEENGKTVGYGALTFNLCQELQRVEPGMTNRDIADRIKTRVAAATKDRQHSQMEGALDREIFGVRDIEPMNYVRVKSRSESTVTLASGSALGMTVGSKLRVYKDDTKRESEDALLGIVEVKAVRAVSSDARIVEEVEANAIAENARAVEEAHAYHEAPTRGIVSPSSDHPNEVEALAHLIEESALLELTDQVDRADFCAYLISPRQSAGDDAPVPQLEAIERPTWAVVGVDGRLAMPCHAIDETNVNVVLRENLEKQAKFGRAIKLENDNPNHALRGKIECVLKRKVGDAWVDALADDAGGDVVFEEGEFVGLEVTNHHSANVYAHVIDFGLTRRISPLPGSQEPITPGGTLQVGMREGSQLRLKMPEDFPYVQDPGEAAPDGGLETLKIFVTTHEADFRPLVQEGMRSASGSSQSPLSDLLSLSLTGHATRDLEVVQEEPGEDWTTEVRSFFLRRRAFSPERSPGR